MSHKSTQVELLPPGLNIHNSTVSYYLFSSSTNAGISGLENSPAKIHYIVLLLFFKIIPKIGLAVSSKLHSQSNAGIFLDYWEDFFFYGMYIFLCPLKKYNTNLNLSTTITFKKNQIMHYAMIVFVWFCHMKSNSFTLVFFSLYKKFFCPKKYTDGNGIWNIF